MNYALIFSDFFLNCIIFWGFMSEQVQYNVTADRVSVMLVTSKKYCDLKMLFTFISPINGQVMLLKLR